MRDGFPFDAVIFDMDGVIVDTELYYWRELRSFSEDLGLGVSAEELNDQVGESNQVFRCNLVRWLERGGYGSLFPEEAERVYDRWAAGRPRDYASLLNPGVREALHGLSARGVRLALASSSPTDNIREVLLACGVEGAFEVVVSGADLAESKPNPEIYLRALDELGLSAEASCCIEDSVPGIAAGKRAGLTVLARREERFGFSQAEADYVIERVDDVLFPERWRRPESRAGKGPSADLI